jgi:hypothetical protein
VEYGPYTEKKLGDIESFTAKVIKEQGVFPFRQETVWRVDGEDEWPCLLYRIRYVFESDPIAFARDRRIRNLYYLLEEKEPVESTRIYFAWDDAQRLTAREMISLGISKGSFW